MLLGRLWFVKHSAALFNTFGLRLIRDSRDFVSSADTFLLYVEALSCTLQLGLLYTSTGKEVTRAASIRLHTRKQKQ